MTEVESNGVEGSLSVPDISQPSAFEIEEEEAPSTITTTTTTTRHKKNVSCSSFIGRHHDLLWSEEQEVRRTVDQSPVNSNLFVNFLANTYASVSIFVGHLISLESILSISMSVAMTIFSYEKSKENSSFDGSAMDWVLLSFAVITPISAWIGMAFSRREQALQHVAVMKSTLWSIFAAHACWDWEQAGKPNTGRLASPFDWRRHADAVLETIFHITHETTRLLTLPNSSRARHRTTKQGKAEALKIITVQRKLNRSIMQRLNALTELCEVFKREGLPSNEATRVRQWERMIAERIDLLIMIKKYRTPQALRSFARLFTLFLPPFYAPYYGQLASDMNSLGVGIAFSVLTATALTSLFESITQMEDPFVGYCTLDGVNVHRELVEELRAELLDCRKHYFPDAGPYLSTDRPPPHQATRER